MPIYEWQQGSGRGRNFKPWPAYRDGAVAEAPWDLTVGNASTLYGYNASVGAISPQTWKGIALAELYTDTGDALVVKFAGGAEVIADNVQIKIGTDTADLTFVTDQYEGTDATIAAAISAANGTTIEVELLEVSA